MALPQQLSELLGALSGMGSKELIGIDFGAHSIKVSILSPLGKANYKVIGFASAPMGEAMLIEDEIQKIDEVVELLAEAVKSTKTRSKAACLGLFGPNTITKRLQVPDGTKEDVEDHIMWESEQYIPFGVDDSEVVHQILGENEGGGFDVIMAAARVDLVESYMDIIKKAGLTVRTVDLSVFALNNYFESLYHEELEDLSEEGAIIIDFGAQTTKVLVYKNAGPLYTKEINLGGVLVTEEIQRQMGVSYEEAEDLKINGDDSGNIPEDFVGIFDSHIENLMDEIKKSVSYYIQTGDQKIQRCYVTGGSMNLSGLLEALEAKLECEVIVMDPRYRYKFDKKISDKMIEELAQFGAVSMGLSMRVEG